MAQYGQYGVVICLSTQQFEAMRKHLNKSFLTRSDIVDCLLTVLIDGVDKIVSEQCIDHSKYYM